VNRRQMISIFLAFVAGIFAAVWIPVIAHRFVDTQHREQVQRLTSPDGTVDAVIENINCGVPCGLDYALSVVRKGAPPAKDSLQQVFLGDDVLNLRVRWKEPHLLEVGYDRAMILDFRNVTYPLAQPGNLDSYHYGVEIQLSPSSTHFSYLKDGNGSRTEQ
jgi:hypothetical protein